MAMRRACVWVALSSAVVAPARMHTFVVMRPHVFAHVSRAHSTTHAHDDKHANMHQQLLAPVLHPHMHTRDHDLHVHVD